MDLKQSYFRFYQSIIFCNIFSFLRFRRLVRPPEFACQRWQALDPVIDVISYDQSYGSDSYYVTNFSFGSIIGVNELGF